MIGLPEAMVQWAQLVLLLDICSEHLGAGLSEGFPEATLIELAWKSKQINCLEQMFFCINNALCLDYIAPLTLKFAKAAKELNLAGDVRLQNNSTIQSSVKNLLQLEEYNMLERWNKNLLESTVVHSSDPDHTVIELFGKYVTKIFCDIPVDSSFKMHMEYQQIVQAPFPFVAFAIVPQTKVAMKIVRLPENLQISAFSPESFWYVWL